MGENRDGIGAQGGISWELAPCDEFPAMVGHLGPGLLGEWEVTSEDCSSSFLIGLLKWKIIPVHFLPTASLICIKKLSQ